jgi:hypothetical protein
MLTSVSLDARVSEVDDLTTRVLPQMDDFDPFTNLELLLSSVQTFVLRTPELLNAKIPIPTPSGLFAPAAHEGLTPVHLLSDLTADGCSD